MQTKTLIRLLAIAVLALGSFAGCAYSTAALATLASLIVAQRFSQFICGEYPTQEEKMV